jgi:hypothetical protein
VPSCFHVLRVASTQYDWICSLVGADTILDEEGQGLGMFSGGSMALMVP